MSERWIEPVFVDHRFGFPVHLLNVPMKQLRGEGVPMLNGKILRLGVLSALVVKPGFLTGAEVRFIRLWLEKTLVAFGQELDVTHAAVNKWESQGDKPTGTSRSTDFLIRYLVLERLLQEELPWSQPVESSEGSFLQRWQETVVQERESPRFLQRVRESISQEIAESSADEPPLSLPVDEIPTLLSGSQVA